MDVGTLVGGLGTGGFLLLVMLALMIGIRRRSLARRPHHWDEGFGEPDDGVREPRRPRPTAGAGAVALPIPRDHSWDDPEQDDIPRGSEDPRRASA